MLKCFILLLSATYLVQGRQHSDELTVHRKHFPTWAKCTELDGPTSGFEKQFKYHKVEGYEEGTCSNAGFSVFDGNHEVCHTALESGNSSWCLRGRQFSNFRSFRRSNSTRTIHKTNFPNDGECGQITLPIEDAYDKERIFDFFGGNCSKYGYTERIGIKHSCMWEFPCSFWCDDFTVFTRED